MTILDFLRPQDISLGPPLPSGLGIMWPWVTQGITNSTTSLPEIRSPSSNDAPAYENDEYISFPEGFDSDTGMPRVIKVHRKYRVRSGNE